MLHLLWILPCECYSYFEYCHLCYTYFQYYHLSATLTFNTTIWVLHLLSILQVQHSNGNIKSNCSTQMVVLKVSVAQMAVFKVRVALTWQYFNTTIWVLHLLVILSFECYTFFQYYHLSVTPTFNTAIKVLHLISILPFTHMAVFKVSVTFKWQYRK
jgi:hypothetical protein